jgi:hypothetical protein
LVNSSTGSSCETFANVAGTAPAFTQLCDEPPLGGFFFTNRSTTDPTFPTFLPVNLDESLAYVSDLGDAFVGGPGRIRIFRLSAEPFCLVNLVSGGACNLAVQNFVVAVPNQRDLVGPIPGSINPMVSGSYRRRRAMNCLWPISAPIA